MDLQTDESQDWNVDLQDVADKKNGADQAMTSPPLEERSIMMSAESRLYFIQNTLNTRFF